MEVTERPSRLRSIWCVPAARARGVLVLARYSDQQRGWTHLLRWTPGEGIEDGAWAKLSLVRHRCRVDPSGEFLRYEAKKRKGGAWNDPRPEPFRGSVGGGMAVSRVPWLSALTDIEGFGQLGGGGGVSKHGLSARDQEVLWRKFPPESDSMNWFQHQQPGWNEVSAKERAELLAWHGVQLPERWVGVQRHSRVQGELLISFAWPAVHQRSTQSVSFAWRTPHGEVYPMKQIAWASIAANGTVLTASEAGQLRAFRADRECKGDVAIPWLDGLRLIEEHDISERTPEPGPSPGWARKRLSRG